MRRKGEGWNKVEERIRRGSEKGKMRRRGIKRERKERWMKGRGREDRSEGERGKIGEREENREEDK